MGTRKKFKHSEYAAKVSLLELIKRKLANSMVAHKEIPLEPLEPLVRVAPRSIHVYHIAVVLDGEVQEVIRADSKIAALFLSSPEFVEFNPREETVTIGTKYVDGKLQSEPPAKNEAGHTHV